MVKYHSNSKFPQLRALTEAVEEWGSYVDRVYGGDRKYRQTDPALDKFIFEEDDANSLYPAALVYCPLSLGEGGIHYMDDDSEARGHLLTPPGPHVPRMPNGGQFPVYTHIAVNMHHFPTHTYFSAHVNRRRL